MANQLSDTHSSVSSKTQFPKRSGALPCTLQNDYLFKAVLQTNEAALRIFLCALLHLEPEEISSAVIENPIVLGRVYTDKDTILDIHVLLNHDRAVNIEMQRVDEGDWPDRSLVYLCRTFDRLRSGSPYTVVLPAQHIGILDFPLRHLEPEFYGTYYFMNRKTYKIYSDKLCVSVLNLHYIHLATEEDRKYRLDQLGALLKAATWEELYMITAENPDFQSIIDAIHLVTENREFVDAYRRHEEERAYRLERERLVEEQALALQEQKARIAELERALAESKRQNGRNPFSKWKSLFHKH